MLILLQGANVYSPEKMGKRDVLLANGKIEKIAEKIEINSSDIDIKIIDVSAFTLTPGIIDAHVHLIGGGGENGYSSRTPEVTLSNITRWGVTTVVGLLGTDGTSRHMESLLSKAFGLEEEGISTYIYSGSYEVPMVTLTGSLRRDILLIEKIIGAGEIAISDHRSSAPGIDEIEAIAAQSRVAGMLSRKAGVLHLHIGDGKEKLDMINEIVERSDIPIFHFRPTHCNRNRALLEEAIKFAKKGGIIDFTSSLGTDKKNNAFFTPAEAVKYAMDCGVADTNITLSSDGNGSLPVFDENSNIIGLQAASLSSMYYQLKSMVYDVGLPLERALKIVTSNVADGLKFESKGHIREGFDADIILFDENFDIQYVFAKSREMVAKGEILVKGTFE